MSVRVTYRLHPSCQRLVKFWFTGWSDLSGFSRLELVLPFLAVVRSREANGVLTDAALRSIQAFLGKRLIGKCHAARACYVPGTLCKSQWPRVLDVCSLFSPSCGFTGLIWVRFAVPKRFVVSIAHDRTNFHY